MNDKIHELPISLKVIAFGESIERITLEKGSCEIQFFGTPSKELKDKTFYFWQAYLRKQPIGKNISLSLCKLPVFTQKVLRKVEKIGFGETTSYKKIAEEIGCPGGTRAVGSACGKNPYPLLIPCHRVVAKNHIGGFAFPLEIKKNLIRHEIGMEFA